MIAWFLGLEDVLSWLLVDKKRDATTADINVITLLRQAIGSSPRRNTRITSLDSICGNSIGGGNNAAGKARVVKCYNCQGERHMARKCTQPKRPKNFTLFKEKMLMVQAQEAGQELDEEQLAFSSRSWNLRCALSLCETMTSSKSFNNNPKHMALYHALMERILAGEDAMDQEETVFEDVDTNGPLNQEDDMGDADEQPDVEAVTKDDWFKKPIRPPTPDLQWNKDKLVDNEPAHT
nr:hypothetical protein [Tanacetum cinerariifolium]